MSEDYELMVRKISQILLESPKKMIKESDIINLIDDEDMLDEIISDINSRFEQINYEIVKTRFINDVYYIVTSEGMDKNLTPQMYGFLAIIVGLNKDLGRDLEVVEVEKIFSEIWEEIEFLIENNYIAKYEIKGRNVLIPTPMAKILFKDLISDLNIDKIMQNLGLKDDV